LNDVWILVRGIGIRDISRALKISVAKVLKVLKTCNHTINPKRAYYGRLEIDEFWTYAGKKENKLRLIYAYRRETGETVAYVWGGVI
jgi:hypothetical protein